MCTAVIKQRWYGGDRITKTPETVGAGVEFASAGGDPAKDELPLPVTKTCHVTGEPRIELLLYFAERETIQRAVLKHLRPLRPCCPIGSCGRPQEGRQCSRGTQRQEERSENYAVHGLG